MEEYITIDKPFWKSKKWMTAVLAAIVPVANAVLGLELDISEVVAVIVPLVAYILGQAKVDAEH